MNRYSFSNNIIHFSPSISGEASYEIPTEDFFNGVGTGIKKVKTKIKLQKELMGATSTFETLEEDQLNPIIWCKVIYFGPKYIDTLP